MFFKKKKKVKSNLELQTINAGVLKNGKMYLSLESASWQKEMLNGDFDKFIYDKLSNSGNLSEKVFWDVGAHVGYHTLCFSRLAGSGGKVIAFEPNVFNYERLAINCDANPDLKDRIVLEKNALSDRDGLGSFVFNNNIDTGESSGSGLVSGFLGNPDINITKSQTMQVSMIKADNYVDTHQDLSPDIIKIDVEGAEYSVLSGAERILSTKKPTLIIEIHNVTCMFNVQNLLSKHNYSIELLHIDQTSSARCHIFAS